MNPVSQITVSQFYAGMQAASLLLLLLLAGHSNRSYKAFNSTFSSLKKLHLTPSLRALHAVAGI